MKGQISIDYVAGGLVFFGAIIFLVGNLLSVVPQFEQSQQQNDLQMTAYSISEVLLNDKGYWENATDTGTDWEDQPEADIETIGLSGGNELAQDKVDAFLDLPYSTIQDRFNVSQDLNVQLHEYVDVDTHTTFEQGSPPTFLIEPAYSGSTSSTVHYGAKRVDSQQKRFMLTDELDWYNTLRVSDDWDFSNANTETYNLTGEQFIPIGSNTYTAPAFVTRQSEGNLLVLQRRIGRTGVVPPGFTASILSIRRYGVLNGNVVRMEVQLWE